MSIDPSFTAQALMLPPEERAELARQLIVSLESVEVDPDIDALWEVELESRLASLDRGEVETVDWREAIASARQSLKRGDRA